MGKFVDVLTERSAITLMVVVVLFIAAFAFSAWIIMLIWGALGSFFGFRTIPYGIAVLVSLTLWVIGGVFSNK